MPIEYRNGPYMDCGALVDEIARLKASRAMLANAFRLQLDAILDGAVEAFRKVFPEISARATVSKEDPDVVYVVSRNMVFAENPERVISIHFAVDENFSVIAFAHAYFDGWGYWGEGSAWGSIANAEAALRSLVGDRLIQETILPDKYLYADEQEERTRFQTLRGILCPPSPE